MQLTKAVRADELERALKADHAALEERFCQVASTMRMGDLEFVRAAWQNMETDLLAHLAAEEELILPRFAEAHPEQAARIRREHDEIRSALQKLGIELDLHSLRAERADEFVHSLREHASHEDEEFYRWAQERLSASEQRSVFARLRSLVHAQGHNQSTAKSDA